MADEQKEPDVISEFCFKKKTSEIPFFIYELPVSNLDEKHSENGELANRLRYKNFNRVIAFNENLIGSFEKIKDSCGAKVNKEKEGVINPSQELERKLLERLLKRQIVCNAEDACYNKISDEYLQIKEPVWQDDKIELFLKVYFNINIDPEGYIFVNTGITHDINSKITLEKELKAGNVHQGEKVKDKYHGKTYFFDKIADFTISEKNGFMKQSITEYYEQKGQGYITKNIPLDTKAVLVKTNEGGILPYISARLCKVMEMDDLPYEAKRALKLPPTKKMQLIIDNAVELSWSSKILRADSSKEGHANKIKSSMICKNQGYFVKDYKKPEVLFGNNEKLVHSYSNLMRGITDFGPYKKKEAIEIRYFVDGYLLKSHLKTLKEITNELETRSAKNGVKLKRIQISDKVDFENINMDDETSFELLLRSETEKGTFESPTIFILSNKHLEKHYGTIKKILGGRAGITTQCVNFEKLEKDEKGRAAHLTNILLGVYAKSGIQSWALAKPLNSDCFVGLDVSRESGVNKSAFVQVLGKDGGVISSKIFAASQSGEKIEDKVLKDIFLDAVCAYKNRYGENPHHITFHRDGRCFENLNVFDEMSKCLNIKYDYIEITKKTGIRMATFRGTKEMPLWKTVIGRCYKKANFAYLCTTEPWESIGMAEPIKITQKTSVLDFDKIIEDVWRLTFMHVHSLAKTRLPATTHYADLCSTFGIRDWLPSGDTESCLFFV